MERKGGDRGRYSTRVALDACLCLDEDSLLNAGSSHNKAIDRHVSQEEVEILPCLQRMALRLALFFTTIGSRLVSRDLEEHSALSPKELSRTKAKKAAVREVVAYMYSYLFCILDNRPV